MKLYDTSPNRTGTKDRVSPRKRKYAQFGRSGGEKAAMLLHVPPNMYRKWRFSIHVLLLLLPLSVAAQKADSIRYVYAGEKVPAAGVWMEEGYYERVRIGYIQRTVTIRTESALRNPCVEAPALPRTLTPAEARAYLKSCRTNFWVGFAFGSALLIAVSFAVP
jgi:hypothetical protein